MSIMSEMWDSFKADMDRIMKDYDEKMKEYDAAQSFEDKRYLRGEDHNNSYDKNTRDINGDRMASRFITGARLVGSAGKNLSLGLAEGGSRLSAKIESLRNKDGGQPDHQASEVFKRKSVNINSSTGPKRNPFERAPGTTGQNPFAKTDSKVAGSFETAQKHDGTMHHMRPRTPEEMVERRGKEMMSKARAIGDAQMAENMAESAYRASEVTGKVKRWEFEQATKKYDQTKDAIIASGRSDDPDVKKLYEYATPELLDKLKEEVDARKAALRQHEIEQAELKRKLEKAHQETERLQKEFDADLGDDSLYRQPPRPVPASLNRHPIPGGIIDDARSGIVHSVPTRFTATTNEPTSTSGIMYKPTPFTGKDFDGVDGDYDGDVPPISRSDVTGSAPTQFTAKDFGGVDDDINDTPISRSDVTGSSKPIETDDRKSGPDDEEEIDLWA